MKSDGSKRIKNDNVQGYGTVLGPNKPQFNKVAALPKNMNKPFLKRLVEWFTV